MQTEPSTYSEEDSYECLPCAEGCDSCEDASPCIAELNWPMRTTILILACAIIGFLPPAALFTFRYQQVKVSWLLLVGSVHLFPYTAPLTTSTECYAAMHNFQRQSLDGSKCSRKLTANRVLLEFNDVPSLNEFNFPRFLARSANGLRHPPPFS
jgi:hypothetical protein